MGGAVGEKLGVGTGSTPREFPGNGCMGEEGLWQADCSRAKSKSGATEKNG